MKHSFIPIHTEKDYTKVDYIYNENVKKAIITLQQAGILSSSVNPNATVSRSEACTILYRYVLHMMNPNLL